MRSPSNTILLCFVMLTVVNMGCNAPIHYPDGGYDYPKSYTAKDTTFYYFPLRRLYSRRDSFFRATNFFYYRYSHEPNLSLMPNGQDVFRLLYSEALGGTYIITLTEKEIIVKLGDGSYEDYAYKLTKSDGSRPLTGERYLLWQIQLRFPFDTAGLRPGSKRHIDSILQLYPQLKSVDYCWNLLNTKMLPTQNFRFITTHIPITKQDFRHIVSVINASGYWNMPPQIVCKEVGATDGEGFSLEANTFKKYNYVAFGTCNDNTKQQLAFCKACQEIIKYAKLNKRIQLYDSDTSQMGPTAITPADSINQ